MMPITRTLRDRTGPGGLLLLVFSLLLAVAPAAAFERYNDGCQNCHGAFTDGTTTKGSVFPRDDKHRMHRSSSNMNADCNLCHSSGDGRDPFIGSSDGTASIEAVTRGPRPRLAAGRSALFGTLSHRMGTNFHGGGAAG